MAITKERFARKFIAALRDAGVDGDITYDAENFSLKDGQGRLTNLGNFFAEYQQVGFFRRGATLKLLVQSALAGESHPIPASFDEAAPNLLPRVRDLAYYGIATLHLELQGMKFPETPRREFAGELAFELCFDTPFAMSSINADRLEEWGKTFDEALEVARASMRARSNDPFDTPVPGLHVSPWRDNHDAGRLACFELINHQRVRGEHIAMVPNRDVLLVTGSEDIDGQAAMLALAESALQDGRTISGIPLVLEAGGWRRWSVPADHPLAAVFHRLDVLNTMDVYAQQKELLDRLHERDEVDLFVASYSAREHEGVVASYCVWTRGADSLLPRTDLVALLADTDGAEPVLVPWEAVQEVSAQLLEPAGMSPERWRARSFPNAEQLRELRERVVE